MENCLTFDKIHYSREYIADSDRKLFVGLTTTTLRSVQCEMVFFCWKRGESLVKVTPQCFYTPLLHECCTCTYNCLVNIIRIYRTLYTGGAYCTYCMLHSYHCSGDTTTSKVEYPRSLPAQHLLYTVAELARYSNASLNNRWIYHCTVEIHCNLRTVVFFEIPDNIHTSSTE